MTSSGWFSGVGVSYFISTFRFYSVLVVCVCFVLPLVSLYLYTLQLKLHFYLPRHHDTTIFRFGTTPKQTCRILLVKRLDFGWASNGNVTTFTTATEHINICIYGLSTAKTRHEMWAGELKRKTIKIDFQTTEHLPNALNKIEFLASIFVSNAKTCAFSLSVYLQWSEPRKKILINKL